jgi:hypothetical protein
VMHVPTAIKLVRTIPAAEVTPPEGSTGCPF